MPSNKLTNITGRDNPLYKRILYLTTKKGRKEFGEFIIEGRKFVSEALLFCDLCHIVMSETFFDKDTEFKQVNDKNGYGVNIIVLADKLFGKLTTTEHPSGVLAVCKKFGHALSQIKTNGLYVLLEDIGDPGNLGAIIRVADAAGADAVILNPSCAELYNSKVLRAAAGSVFHIPIIENMELPCVIRKFKESNIKTYAAHLAGATYPYNIPFSGGTAFLIGSEAEGLTQQTAELADAFVKLPMPGRAESLNAAVASGVLLYEAVRQRIEMDGLR